MEKSLNDSCSNRTEKPAGIQDPESPLAVGRFAPSPSGRMHLGNLFTALISWLSVRSRGGRWILRIEDLDPQRSKPQFARQIEDDLLWLGLDFDEGGVEDIGPRGPYSQSRRGEIYLDALRRLNDMGLVYPCRCTRADIRATQAPHQSDGRIIYYGKCRPETISTHPSNFNSNPSDSSRLPPYSAVPLDEASDKLGALRLYIPDREIGFTDLVFGPQRFNPAEISGDIVLRRADGAWAYNLAVVVDDALMGVNEVVRGCDLLESTSQQIYLARLLGFELPQYAHLPLICNAEGKRLSKRDPEMDMEHLRRRHSAPEIIGMLAHAAGLLPEYMPITPRELLPLFSWNKIPAEAQFAQ